MPAVATQFTASASAPVLPRQCSLTTNPVGTSPAGQPRGIAPTQTPCRSPITPCPGAVPAMGDNGGMGWVGAMPCACPVTVPPWMGERRYESASFCHSRSASPRGHDQSGWHGGADSCHFNSAPLQGRRVCVAHFRPVATIGGAG